MTEKTTGQPVEDDDLRDPVERPSADPVVLTRETVVNDPDNPGAKITLAAGTQLSAATAARVGVKRPKR